MDYEVAQFLINKAMGKIDRKLEKEFELNNDNRQKILDIVQNEMEKTFDPDYM